MIGIYKITSPTGKIYIGQSINIEKRFCRYKNLNANVKGQTKLYRSFLKHGVNTHVFEIVEECLTEELNLKERYYQELFDCISKRGLNCKLTKTSDKSGKVCNESRIKMSRSQKGKQHWLGRKHTEETKQKISKANKGRKMPEEEKPRHGKKGKVGNRKGYVSYKDPKSKVILQYSLDGKFIREWFCAMDVERELGFSDGNIRSCCNNKLKTAYGYIWKDK